MGTLNTSPSWHCLRRREWAGYQLKLNPTWGPVGYFAGGYQVGLMSARRSEGSTTEDPSVILGGKRRLPVGNPAKAPSVFLNWWRSGRLGRAAVIAYASAILIGLGIGILVGMVTDPHVSDKSALRWAIFGLIVTALSLVLLGGYFIYRADKEQRRRVVVGSVG